MSEKEVVSNSLIGKTEEEASILASSSGYTIRITRRDSERYVVTMDLLDRINIQIDNGIITSVGIG